MEPETKLFPAIFVEATSKEVMQIELGRTSTSLPLSAAVLQNSAKHVIPQFPPRLKVQCLKPHQWARVCETLNINYPFNHSCICLRCQIKVCKYMP